jgi:hypothetical protein
LPSYGKKNVAYLETDQFYKALAEYADASGKDFALAVNLKMRDAAFKSASAAPKASKGAIDQRWGKHSPDARRIVASSLSRGAKKLVYRRSKKGKARRNASARAAGSRTYRRKAWVYYTVAEARAYAAAIRKRRRRAVGFVRAFFVALAQAVEKATPEIPPASKADKTGFEMNYVKATPEYPVGSGKIVYRYKFMKGQTRGADKLLAAAWAEGIRRTIADMQKYITRKMRERAAKHSVK